MARWRVWINWEEEIEAEDEGYALMKAEDRCNFMDRARVEEIENEEEESK